ncbi:MAG: hypothetical protein A3F40_04210 [Chlamydiae bacterium RIFCSPHIGHO2_12_FULL_27_8]|nr:MAG: hypothetical protein A3F40_04210 [Chlamydiae bacterium RIFCSPHIGHO2_12_FULL_27_8]OGN66904.1 MAG: hypothetical protein A2888_01935 [Chlamydiae bacterium RIFCSPLOWO2_01_FULL_28_7]
MQKKILLFLVLILSSFTLKDLFINKSYVYIENTNGEILKSYWYTKKNDDKIVINEDSKIDKTELVFTNDLVLEEYTLKSQSNNSDYHIKRDKNILTAEGLSKGKTLSSRNNIGGENWIQEFKFGLKKFINSKSSTFNFITLNPDDFSVKKLVATKKNIEDIKISDKVYRTQKIDITLQGFFSNFWRAEAWYDLKNYNLIRYKANMGPGTPISVIYLESFN